MKARNLLVAMMLGVSVLGVTGCGQQTQDKPQQTQTQQVERNTISTAKFAKEVFNQTVETNKLYVVKKLEILNEDAQNTEDGEYLLVIYAQTEAGEYKSIHLKVKASEEMNKKINDYMKKNAGKLPTGLTDAPIYVQSVEYGRYDIIVRGEMR